MWARFSLKTGRRFTLPSARFGACPSLPPPKGSSCLPLERTGIDLRHISQDDLALLAGFGLSSTPPPFLFQLNTAGSTLTFPTRLYLPPPCRLLILARRSSFPPLPVHRDPFFLQAPKFGVCKDLATSSRKIPLPPDRFDHFFFFLTYLMRHEAHPRHLGFFLTPQVTTFWHPRGAFICNLSIASFLPNLFLCAHGMLCKCPETHSAFVPFS